MIEFTARDFAAFLREYTEPLRRELAQVQHMGQKEHEAHQRLNANLNSAEKALAEKDAELEKLRAAWNDAEGHVSELTTELNATRAEVSKEREACAVLAEKLEAEKAAHAKTKAELDAVGKALEDVGAADMGPDYAGCIDWLASAWAGETEAHAAWKTKAESLMNAPSPKSRCSKSR